MPILRPISRRTFVASTVAAPFVLRTPHAIAQTDNRPTLTVAVAQLPQVLEPALELNNVGTRVTYSMFDMPIRRDFLGSADGGGAGLNPMAAVSWNRVSSQELIVKLRPGMKFHNGDEVTADDIAYTFRPGRLYGDKPAIPSGRLYFGTLANCEALDKYTARFTTRAPDILLEQRLASWCSWIVNKRAYEAEGIDGFGRQPVGSGPYRFVSMKPADSIVLEAFDDYWAGKPNAKRVIFQEVPELAARIAGLVAGDFDLITNVPPDQIAVIGNYPDIETRSVVLANSHMVTFDARGVATKDRRVRQALAMSINRQQLVDTLWLGKAVIPASHNYPEYGPMYLQGRSLPYNLDKAKSLLSEAGYKGEPISFRTLPNYYTNALDAAQIIIQMWKSIGVNAQVEVVENSVQQNAAGKQVGNDSNSTRLPDPLGAIWVSWGPDSDYQTQGAFDDVAAFNTAGRALQAETDMAKRRTYFANMLDAWEDVCPGTILYQPFETYAIKKSIKWRPYSFYYMDLRNDNLSFGA